MAKVVVIITWIVLLGLPAFCQDSVDDQMKVVKELVSQKRYAEAESICQKMLDASDNSDVRFYFGLILSWDGKYDQAREQFAKLESTRGSNLEFIYAQYNVEYWADAYAAALNILNRGLTSHPHDEGLMLRKAKMLSYLGDRQKAREQIDKVLIVNPNSTEAYDLLATVNAYKRKNTITLDFSNDQFSGTTLPWYSSYLQYTRRTKIGSIIGRFNYTNRFSSNAYQVELDGYLSFWKGGYFYVNGGYSWTSLFPSFRNGLEYFVSLPNAFEASLGYRYMHFTSSDVLLYTGTVGKYFGNYWMSVRPQFRFQSSKISYSVRLTTRRYFSNADTYLGVEAGYGNSPDFLHQNIDYSYLARLKSWSFAASYNQRLAQLWVLSLKFSYSKEEIVKDSFRSQYTSDITIAKYF